MKVEFKGVLEIDLEVGTIRFLDEAYDYRTVLRIENIKKECKKLLQTQPSFLDIKAQSINLIEF